MLPTRSLPARLLAPLALLLALGSVALAQERKVAVPIRLKQLDRLGVVYQAEAVALHDAIEDEREAYHLRVRLGYLTRRQYDGLMKAYRGNGNVPYEPRRKYLLSDFLPAKIQALETLRFLGASEPATEWSSQLTWPTGDGTIYQESNCYSTAWELARGDEPADVRRQGTQFSTWWAAEDQVAEHLTDPRFSDKVSRDSLRSGDIVLYFIRDGGARELLHAAYHVDGSLYFEKSNTYDPFAYRLALAEDIESRVESAVAEGTPTLPRGRLEVEFRRFRGPGKAPLPHVARLLSLDATGSSEGVEMPVAECQKLILGASPGTFGAPRLSLHRILDFRIDFDPATGRARLAPGQPHAGRFVTAFGETSWDPRPATSR